MRLDRWLTGLAVVFGLAAAVAIAIPEVQQLIAYANAQVNPYDKRSQVEATYANIIAMREMFNIATKTQIELEDLEFLDMIFSARQLATLWDEIQRNGPITTWVQLSKIKYWGPSSRQKLAIFYKLKDEQSSVHGYPVY